MLRWGGLGDLLVTLPAIRLLRLGLPDAFLTLVGRLEYADLLLHSKVVDHVVEPDDPRVLPLFGNAGSAGDDKARWLDGFDLIMNWMNQAKSGLRADDRDQAGGARKRLTILFDAGRPEPMSRFFFQKTLEAVANDLQKRAEFDECAKLPLTAIPEDPSLSFARRSLRSRPLVVIHPGSGGKMKRWPLENFLEIARRLKIKGVDGVIVTGEAEEALEGSVEPAARPLEWKWLRRPSLLSLARLLGEADLYLGNDSGITHLAAACGAKVLAFFRNDLIDIWRPFGDAHLLSADSIGEISLEPAWSAAAELLCI